MGTLQRSMVAKLFCTVVAPIVHINVAFGCVDEERRVIGTSLAPIIQDKEIVEVRLGTDCIEPLSRGSIVLIETGARKKPLAKILKGMPGDSFTINEEGLIFINQAALKNSEGAFYRLSPSRAKVLRLYEKSFDGVIPEDAYLVMGDRPSGSLDSTRLGLIHRRDIIGRTVNDATLTSDGK